MATSSAGWGEIELFSLETAPERKRREQEDTGEKPVPL